MAKKVGLISINLLAGTAQYNTQMAAATAKITGFGNAVKTVQSHIVTGNQAAAGFIRVAENGMSNNLRAVENFMTRTLGLGKVMQTIFPVVGAIAFAGLIVSLGEKMYDFFKKSSEGAQRVNNAFREMIGPMRLTNDELRVANDRLVNDLAKLEGKRQNNLQVMLDDARVASDKLGDSLEGNLKKLNEMLQKEKIHWWTGAITGDSTTTALADQMKKFAEDEGEIVDKGQEKIRAAADRKDQKGVDEASNQLAADVTKHRKDTIADLDAQLKIQRDIRDVQEERLKQSGMENSYHNDSNATLINQLRAAREVAESGVEFVDLTQRHTDLEKKVTGAQATDENARLDRPLENKLSSLAADLQQAAEKLGTAHLSEDMKELAAAHREAAKAIDQVNKALKALHEGPMSEADENKIKLVETGIVAVKQEADWQTKMAASTAAMRDRIAAQKQLTAAVGEGFETVRKAAIEFEVMKAVGFEKYSDPKFMADPQHQREADASRAAAAAEYDEKNATTVATTLDKISDHIELEKKLAEVQVKGAQAVRDMTFALEIEKIRRDASADSVDRLVKARTDEYNDEKGNTQAAQLAVILHEIDATESLTAAQVKGAEAARKAGLETKYQAMQRAGDSPDTIAAQRREDELQHQAKITEEVLKTANADRDRLADLDLEEAKARSMTGSAADQLGIMIKIREIENERLDIMARQLLETGRLGDAFKAFFAEMAKEATEPLKALVDGLNSAVNGLSDNLAKLLTRQKTGWTQMFKNVGDEMLKASIKAGIQHGITALGNTSLGKKLGLDKLNPKKPLGNAADPIHTINHAQAPPGGGGTKPGGLGIGERDGQTQETAFYVVSVSDSTGSGASGLGGLLAGSGGALGGLAGLFGGAGSAAAGGSAEAVTSSISYMAGGGEMTADKAYIVGDDGPEIVRKTNGHVTSNSASKKLMAEAGGNHFYTIDARGTDPVLTEQRTRAAIMAAHSSAISKSGQLQAERVKRSPQK